MWLNVIKAILARGFFAIHAFVAVWRVVTIKGGETSYWLLTTSIGLLICEGVLSICKRRGREMKWFCPSVFLYLCCIIPPTWILELSLNETRKLLRTNSSDVQPIGQDEKLATIPGLKLAIDLEMPAELWAKVLEQFLMVNLILGRWLLPKGELTRGQLSQLLLVYIGMAADIVELFEAFKEDAVIFNTELTTAVLAIWSWSLMQFSFVLTATKARKPRLGMDSVPKDNHVSNYDKSCCPNLRAFCIMDIWAIATTIIFQDGPFLCLRLLLILKYNVVSYLNIFFTCKNSLVLVLQLYRMTVLKCETHPMSDDVESIHQGSSKLDHDSDKSETESNKYDEAGVDYLYGNRDDLPWHRSSIHHRRNSETLDKKPSPDMNYNFLPDYFDPIKRIRKGPCRATKDNSLFKNIDGFTEINRDSVYLVYSQSKDAPWTDVSLNLFSTSESNLNKDPKKKSGTVINLHQNKTDELIKRNDIAVQTSEFKNHHKTLKKTKKSSRSALTSEKIHRSKTDEKEATINNVKNCLKSSKSLNKAVSSRMTPSSYCMSTRF